MSNKTQLQTNNTELSSLIETIRGKVAGSGGSGSGASIETCTLSLDVFTDSAASGYFCTCWENNTFVVKSGVFKYGSVNKIMVENVVCNSCVFISSYIGSAFIGHQETNVELINYFGADTLRSFNAGYKITAPAGGTATINVYDND